MSCGQACYQKLGLISQLVRELKGVQHTPLPHENMWISRLLIELQSSPKNQKNPHDQLIWGGNTFQCSIYHSFPLKPGCVNKICSIKMLITP